MKDPDVMKRCDVIGRSAMNTSMHTSIQIIALALWSRWRWAQICSSWVSFLLWIMDQGAHIFSITVGCMKSSREFFCNGKITKPFLQTFRIIMCKIIMRKKICYRSLATFKTDKSACNFSPCDTKKWRLISIPFCRGFAPTVPGVILDQRCSSIDLGSWIIRPWFVMFVRIV